MTNLIKVLTESVFWLNVIVGILIFIFGIVGNCLTIYVFTRPIFRNTTSVLYLLACSIASCIQLIHTLLPRILSDGFRISIVNSSNHYCQIRNLIAAVASLCAISYLCLASFDQFVSTSRNAAIRSNWTSKRFVYSAISLTIPIWIIIYLPLSIFSQASGESCVSNNIILSFMYSYGIIPITYSLLPIILFTYFYFGIVKNLRDAQARVILTRKRCMARQVQRMLIPQLIILVLSGIPFVLQTLYASWTRFTMKDDNRLAIENLINTIVRLLFYLNYVCSFYIYVLMSTAVRKIVRDLVWRHNSVLPHAPVVVIPIIQFS